MCQSSYITSCFNFVLVATTLVKMKLFAAQFQFKYLDQRTRLNEMIMVKKQRYTRKCRGDIPSYIRTWFLLAEYIEYIVYRYLHCRGVIELPGHMDNNKASLIDHFKFNIKFNIIIEMCLSLYYFFIYLFIYVLSL